MSAGTAYQVDGFCTELLEAALLGEPEILPNTSCSPENDLTAQNPDDRWLVLLAGYIPSFISLLVYDLYLGAALSSLLSLGSLMDWFPR